VYGKGIGRNTGSTVGLLAGGCLIYGIGRNTGSTVGLLADGCLMYRDTVNSEDVGKLQIDWGSGRWKMGWK
jgi:hypothetical protein